MNNLTKREQAFFDAAKAISKLSNHKQKLGCIVVDKHQIISSGHNSQTKCHRLQAEFDKRHFKVDGCKGPVHAEFAALLPLIKHKHNLTSATLYIYRENKKSELSLARPCPRCMSLIKQCGIRKIKYSTADGFAAEKLI